MTLVDLFCGCGGFSLGAHNAGFEVAAAFDNDATLTSSFARNFPNTRLYLRDVSKLTGGQIRKLVKRPISGVRSEEHTSELQSLMRISYAVFCLKKKHTHIHIIII